MANIVHSKHFTNYIIIGIGYLLLGASLVYSFLNPEDVNSYGYSLGMVIAQIAGLHLFIKSGSFFKTKYSRYARIGVAIIIISALFKILHYAGSEMIIIVGYGVILLCYTIAFTKKPYKKTLDWLKLVYAYIIIVSILGRFLHWSLDAIATIPASIMLAMILLHIDQQKKLGFPEDVDDDFNL